MDITDIKQVTGEIVLCMAVEGEDYAPGQAYQVRCWYVGPVTMRRDALFSLSKVRTLREGESKPSEIWTLSKYLGKR